ncbi:hypothetical protein A3C20_00380 [Candidatus Kaiserbacteria bacterium RIFCSPHIGHO2_02_FULL_55_25]|uniref:Uncharacterized protein n=1 Tax=Candidatus Kaiserbacteria bacterium RIFCSPHIGHO2_02_FULL_55_25 TaxID=1798498 RepID=A0A1F6E549_9BACT|nr:MAG: hypothetical protein A2764_01775 [Candidatus Kaiserbacteria bacterium RIFCSPHIGHO2_01_FULL_55_79]OGG68813.1 MAG: hypothetical protein A3C20_00380 [Candidatus Kaiserbacteria bacterium RIFCSPHIGHO2_02_FULL_55_25]OGG77287.1 MAG: hypothetical protein A3F56_04470 [Candidatus Kaiserbacteria bacterium RIFCSPHIGHO2_12_FULL_55_13]OGG82983.1 MAG: hypothetical protein A3A42_03655 [Candidatus Kaiserbacteria bacterium RIFCSPLOWO2_01_FULL_55_25]
MATFTTNVDWNKVDFEKIGAQSLIRNPKFAGAQFRAWMENGCRFVIKGPSVLVIDRSKPFDSTRFLGQGSSIWRGPAEGKGLEGEEDQDSRSVALTELDFSSVAFDNFLKEDEPTIIGEEKLVRMKADPRIRYDAGVGVALLDEKGQATLRWLHDTYGITWMEFATVLRYSDGHRCFLFLDRRGGGSWHARCRWLGHGRSAGGVSPVSAS